MKKPEDQLVPAAPKLSLPQDVPPSLKRQGAMYAPVTNYFQGPDAAAGKLVDMRVQRAGATPPSAIGPPVPAAPAAPGLLQRMAPSSAANIRYGTTARAGEGLPEMLGRGTTGALGVITAVPEALARSAVDVAGGAYDAAKRFAGGAVGNPVQPSMPAAAPALATSAAPAVAPGVAPQASGAIRSPLDRPGFVPTPGAAPAPVVDTTMLGPLKRAQAPGEVGRSVSGRALPGAPQVGADGSIVYDQAFMERNKQMIGQYANTNVVPSVVPPPGVAASMATGGQMPVGTLTRRAPGGFTPADRARQMEQLNDLGNNYRQTRAEGRMQFANMEAMAGNTDKAKAMADVFQTGLTRAAPSTQGAALQTDAARLAMEQANSQAANAIGADRARMDAEQQGLDSRAKQLQLASAQRMEALTQQLIGGTPEEKAAAAATLSQLQGTKQGEPIKLDVPIDTGQKDTYGNPVSGKGQMLVDQTGRVVFDPRQQQVRYATHPDGRKLKVYADGTFEEVKPE